MQIQCDLMAAIRRAEIMKIVDVRTIPLPIAASRLWQPGGMQARRGSLLVEIETDDRVIGIGEAGGRRRRHPERDREAISADADRRGPRC